ncbi:MAG: metallophosphoesterase [Elusimicrobia bacterium]|nr:metallophosphoesterase [Elusimicrobiota bacterium]
MKTYHFLPVLLVLILSYIGLHFYAARWLTRSFALDHFAASWLRLSLLAAAFFSVLTLFLKRYPHGGLLEVLYTAGYAWMGVILIAAFLFAAADLAAPGLRRLPGFQPRLLAQATLALLAAITAWSVYGGRKVPAIKEITIPFKDLPPALEGFKIAQISDIHVDSPWKLRQFAGMVEKINSVNPDLVLFTGDLLDPGIVCAAGLDGLMAGIKSRLGLFGCLGNHEYYYGIPESMDCYRAFGIKLLRNEGLDLKELRLAGLGDIHTEHLTERAVAEILDKAGRGKFTILMSHQPVFYDTIAAAGDYLVLSGHTHKGQLFPFHPFVKLFYPYFYGPYRINNSAFYVTSGAGTWGPPLRWLAPSEIPVITLVKAK